MAKKKNQITNPKGGGATPIETILARHSTPLALSMMKAWEAGKLTGWRMKDVAAFIDTSADTFSLYLAGKRVPPVSAVYRIIGFLRKKRG